MINDYEPDEDLEDDNTYPCDYCGAPGCLGECMDDDDACFDDGCDQ